MPMEKLAEGASYYDLLGVNRNATEQEINKGAHACFRRVRLD